jgi:hypothetical protein
MAKKNVVAETPDVQERENLDDYLENHWIERGWEGTFPQNRGVEMRMASIMRTAYGLVGLNDLLTADQDAINMAEMDEDTSYESPIKRARDNLVIARSVLAECVRDDLQGMMDWLIANPVGGSNNG